MLGGWEGESQASTARSDWLIIIEQPGVVNLGAREHQPPS